MKKLLLISILFLVCLTTNAFAMNVDLTRGNSNHSYIHVDANNDGIYENDAGYNDAYKLAGTFRLEFNNNLITSTPSGAYGFCIDITTNSGSGTASDIFGLITTESLRKSAWVMENFWNIGNSGAQNAGIQLAIWDFIYGVGANGFDRFEVLDITASGHLSYDEYDKIITEYNDEYPANGFDAVNYRTVDFDTKQDMIIKIAPVPEPATMALFGLGLLGISFVGRKRK